MSDLDERVALYKSLPGVKVFNLNGPPIHQFIDDLIVDRERLTAERDHWKLAAKPANRSILDDDWVRLKAANEKLQDRIAKLEAVAIQARAVRMWIIDGAAAPLDHAFDALNALNAQGANDE